MITNEEKNGRIIEIIDDFVCDFGTNWRPATVRWHRERLTTFSKWLRERDIFYPESITYRHIAKYFDSQKGQSFYTRRASFQIIEKFFRWLEVTEQIKTNIFATYKQKGILKLGRKNRTIKQSVKLDVIEQLIEFATEQGDQIGYRDAAIMRLMATTGIRRGEVVRILMVDCDFASRPASIKINGKGANERMVYLPEKTTEAIMKWLEHRPKKSSAHLFVSLRSSLKNPYHGLNADSLNNMLRKRAEHLEIEGSVSPHNWRRFYATGFIAKGGSPKYLQEFMGHQDISTTMGYVDQELPDTAAHAIKSAPDI